MVDEKASVERLVIEKEIPISLQTKVSLGRLYGPKKIKAYRN